jgi:peptide alpha-N-acetyltransferase
MLSLPFRCAFGFIISELVQTLISRLQTALAALSLLSSLNSLRADKFRTACQSEFELSTVFEIPSELAPLREQVLLGSPNEPILEEAAQDGSII